MRARIDAVLPRACSLLQVAVTKLGRSCFVVAYIRPGSPVKAEEMDALCEKLQEEYRAILQPVKSEAVFTALAPFQGYT